MIDFRRLQIIQLEIIATVVKGVEKTKSLKFIGLELGKIVFNSKENIVTVVNKKIKIRSIIISI